jgi:hypothetical protein
MNKQLFICWIVACVSAPLWAQTRVEQVEGVQTRRQLQQQTSSAGPVTSEQAPEIAPGELQDTGPQYLVRVKERRKWVEASVDSQFYYTSNLFLAEEDFGQTAQNALDDTSVWVNTAEFAFAPDPFKVPGGQLSPRVGFRHQWFNYGLDSTENGYNNLDFDAQTVYGDLDYRFLEHWVAGIGFDWLRLLNHEGPIDDYAEFYNEYVPHFTLTREIPIKDFAAVLIQYEGDFHFTRVNQDTQPDQDINDRTEQTLLISYVQEVLPRLYLQPFGRFQFTHYTRDKDIIDNNFRNDYLYSCGLTVAYVFNDWASVRSFISYDHRESDDMPLPDYSVWNGGLGATALLRF